MKAPGSTLSAGNPFSHDTDINNKIKYYLFSHLVLTVFADHVAGQPSMERVLRFPVVGHRGKRSCKTKILLGSSIHFHHSNPTLLPCSNKINASKAHFLSQWLRIYLSFWFLFHFSTKINSYYPFNKQNYPMNIQNIQKG